MYVLCIDRVTKLQYTCIMSHGMLVCIYIYIYILGIRI